MIPYFVLASMLQIYEMKSKQQMLLSDVLEINSRSIFLADCLQSLIAVTLELFIAQLPVDHATNVVSIEHYGFTNWSYISIFYQILIAHVALRLTNVNM